MDYSKLLLKASACVITVALVGCASPGNRTALMPLRDLDSFETNCANADQQIELLQRQVPTAQTIRENQIIMSTTGGVLYSMTDGTYQERYNQASGVSRSVARSKIRYLKTWCPVQEPPRGF